MADNRQIAEDVVEALGGKDNITFATHCMTRLRVNLKNDNVDDERVKAVNGVLAVARAGEQYQVVIGQNVAKVYPEVLAITGLAEQAAVDENLDKEKAPLTPKAVGTAILDYLSGSMVPAIPTLMIAGLFKTIQVVLGPAILNVLPADSGLNFFLGMVYNAGMYFLPFYLAYNAANKLGVRPIVALMLAGVLLEPSFVELVGTEGASLDILGLPVRLVNYKQSVVPILLSVWVMSYVESFFKKVVPDILSTVFVPFLTMLVMAPLALVALAPIGNFLGEFVASALFGLYDAGGIVTILAMVLLMSLQPYLVITGMHAALVTFGLTAFAANGTEPYVLVCNLLSNFAIWGGALAAALRFKDPDDKGNAFAGFVSGFLGGVNEPNLFGLYIPHQRMFVGMTAANAVVGLLAAILGVKLYNMGISSIMSLLTFVSADDPSNVVNAAICGGVGFALGFVLTWLFGLTKEEIEGKQAA